MISDLFFSFLLLGVGQQLPGSVFEGLMGQLLESWVSTIYTTMILQKILHTGNTLPSYMCLIQENRSYTMSPSLYTVDQVGLDKRRATITMGLGSHEQFPNSIP